MKYSFGVMSCKYEMEADDMINAYISMALFIGKDIPVAVYEPQSYCFLPSTILENNKMNANPKLITKYISSIKKVD